MWTKKLLTIKRVREAKEEIFRLPNSLSGKGCVIIASLKGDVIQLIVDFWEETFLTLVKYPMLKVFKGNIPKVGDSIDAGGIIVTDKNSQAILLLTNGTLATLNEIQELSWKTFGRPPLSHPVQR